MGTKYEIKPESTKYEKAKKIRDIYKEMAVDQFRVFESGPRRREDAKKNETTTKCLSYFRGHFCFSHPMTGKYYFSYICNAAFK